MIKYEGLIYTAIVTKHLGPTNTIGQRVKAIVMSSAFLDRPKTAITVSYDYAYSTAYNHRCVAQLLLDKLGWTGDWVMGATDTGYVFIKVAETCER